MLILRNNDEDGPCEAASANDNAQTLINSRYEVVREIGGGGMSQTYLAIDTKTRRNVFLKISPLLSDSEPDERMFARFVREADALRRLRHPNIVQLLDTFVIEQRRRVLVLEYIDGTSLRRYVETRGPLPLRAFVPIASQILKGVQYVHARGTVLRDIKPANVMLYDRGDHHNVVKLIDFGLTRLLDGTDRITRDSASGTAGFIAPEELVGDPVGLRADVYSLGMLFFFLLTEDLPFEGEGPALLYKQANATPRSLSSALPPKSDVPEALVTLIDDCTRSDPNRRPADATEVMERLIDAVPARMFRLPRLTSSGTVEVPSGEDSTQSVTPSHIVSAVTSTTSQTPPPPDRRRSRIGAVAFTLVVAAVGAIGLLSFESDKTSERPADSVGQAAEVDAAISAPLKSYKEPENPAPLEDESQVPSDPGPAFGPTADVGTLLVTSRPVALVRLDGQTVGKTPLEVAVPAGAHNVRISSDGYVDWSAGFDLQTGEREAFDVELEKKSVRVKRVRAPARSSKKKSAPSTNVPPVDEPPLIPARAPAQAPKSAPAVPKLSRGREFDKLERRGLKGSARSYDLK